MTPIDTVALATVTGGYTSTTALMQQQLLSLQTTLQTQQTQPSQTNQLAMGFALGTLMNR